MPVKILHVQHAKIIPLAHPTNSTPRRLVLLWQEHRQAPLAGRLRHSIMIIMPCIRKQSELGNAPCHCNIKPWGHSREPAATEQPVEEAVLSSCNPANNLLPTLTSSTGSAARIILVPISKEHCTLYYTK